MEKPIRDLLPDTALDQRALVAVLLAALAGLTGTEDRTSPLSGSPDLRSAMQRLADQIGGTFTANTTGSIKSVSVRWRGGHAGVMITYESDPAAPTMLTLTNVSGGFDANRITAMIDALAGTIAQPP